MRQSDSVIVEKAPPALQPLVLCAIWRDFTGSSSAEQVHANAYASLNVVLHGVVEAPRRSVCPRYFVTGPFARPLATAVRGPLRSVCLVFQPWLLKDIFALSPASLADSVQAITPWPTIQARQWMTALDRSAPGDPSFWKAIASAIPVDARRCFDALALPMLRDHGTRAATRASGLGERHYRRVFLQHLGLSPKTWMRLQRFDAFVQALTDNTSLSALAAHSGYADQAHMTREARSIANHPPGQLRTGIAQRRWALWALMPAEVRFVQDQECGPF
ncbi:MULTISPECIES: helix-turn-helix domain-containing protein [Variovorax]|uniref:helix-turn-helix domain-containing protein n=1 Tax=Variovorax TaxID=34072 RepID=UPI002859C614|nr:helix-turn-helix domain-containing protein [Variovorax sp. 3319]MDR6890978.1 AraC-like DNA-binding protein [Variovorax sp. 3319]